HQEIGHKSLLQSDALYQYILERSVYPKEQQVFFYERAQGHHCQTSVEYNDDIG
ncbi:hypothetical protein Droror1_Dr00006345, partial [Drosera rotundifolia]